MSGSAGDLILRGAEDIWKQPGQMAEAAKTTAQVPLTYAQLATEREMPALRQAETEQAQALAGLYGAQSSKAQIEADMSRYFYGRMQNRGQGSQNTGQNLPGTYNDGSTTGSGGGGGAGGGGGGIGPGTPGQPGETTRDLTAYAMPPPGYQPPAGPAPAPGVGSGTMIAAAQPPITARYPGSYQLADASGTTPPPASAALAAAGDQTQLGFGGVTAGGGPIMVGQTTAQPVRPNGAGQLGRATNTTPPNMVTSDKGEYMPELGFVVPSYLADTYYRAMIPGMGGDPNRALADIETRRRSYLMQQAYGANTPAQWDKAVEREYLSGWLSVADYNHLHGDFGQRVESIRKLDPDKTRDQDNAMTQQGLSWSDQIHQYVWDTTLHAGSPPKDVGWINMGNGVWVPDKATENQIAARAGVPIKGPGGETVMPGAGGGAGGGGGDHVRPPVAAPGSPQSGNAFDQYKNAVHGHEGYKPEMGNYGFIPSTKVTVARKYLGADVANMSDDQIKAMQLSPDQEDRMMRGFTADNAVMLQQGGMRLSGSNLGMAHYIGAQGVLNLLKVSPDTTMAEMERQGLLTPGTVKANANELGGNTTVRGFVQWAHRQYGNDTITPDDIQGRTRGTQVADSSGGTGGGGGGGGGGGPAPAPGGGPPAPGQVYQGRPSLPEGTGEISKGNIAQDNAAVNTASDAAIAAQGEQRVVQDMLDRVPPLEKAGAFGPMSDFRTRALAFVHTALKNSAGQSDLLKKFDDWGDFKSQPDREAFIKEATQLALKQEAALPGVRSGIGIAAMVGKGTPSLDMQGDTVRELLNRLLVGHIMTQDYANGLREAVSNRQSSIDLNVERYDPVQRDYDKQWTDTKSLHHPNVYLGAASLLTDDGKSGEWKRRLSPQQQTEALKLAMRANPDWVPPGYKKVQQ